MVRALTETMHIAPMLATAAAEIPADAARWGFEFKWDGVRAISYVEKRRLRLESRNMLDITRRYPELDALAGAMGRHSVILDGEIVALDQAGLPSFGELQKRMHVESEAKTKRLMHEVPVFYVVFDLLFLDGVWLTDRPFSERRERLVELVPPDEHWQTTVMRVGQGKKLLAAARKKHMEGVVAKRLESTYEPGRRSRDWLKIKITKRQEFVVGGWIEERENPNRIGAMLLGYHDTDGKLRFAGGVGTGLNGAWHERLVGMFRRLGRETSPFADPVPRRGVKFLKPTIVIEVEYRRWPPGGLVQQGAFKGLREDKSPADVIRE